MSKLHELLAVEADLDSVQKNIAMEAINSFTKKTHLFFGYQKELKHFIEGLPEAPKDTQALETTVNDKLAYVNDHIIRYFDAVYQKELTNQTAKSDIVIGDKVLAKDVPATFLLGLENKLKSLRLLYNAIPTLPSGVSWIKDVAYPDDVFLQSPSEEKYKTAKTFKHKVLYEATEHHPAQIERWEETENVGMYITHKWTGMLPVAQKSIYLSRLDKLLRAVKQARQRANTASVTNSKIAKDLFDYIMQE